MLVCKYYSFKIIACLFIFLSFFNLSKIYAQDNTGKEFWFTLFSEAYLDHLPGIYMVGHYDCQVTIDYIAKDPALDMAGDPECTRRVLNLTGGVPLFEQIPYDGQAICWRYTDTLETPEIVQHNGIRVTSTAPISLYSQHYGFASSEMTPILPVEHMGTDYIVTAYREIRNTDENFNARATVTAIENGTVVTFSLPNNTWTSKHTTNTATGINSGMLHGPGSVWSVTLNRGQTYTIISNDNESDGNVLSTTAEMNAVRNYIPAGSSVSIGNNQGLNGVRISSSKKISVMGGTDGTWIGIDEYTGCGAADLTCTHLKPTNRWTTRYITTQTLQRPNPNIATLNTPPPPNIFPYPPSTADKSISDYLLIVAKDSATNITITGKANYTKTLNKGEWFIYESPGKSAINLFNPGATNHLVVADKPIQITQMMKGWECDNNNPADPTQMLVIEESLWRDNYIITNPTQYINNFFVFIIKEPLGTNIARNTLQISVNGINVAIPAGNSLTNDGSGGWSQIGVEPYYYQRLNIAAGGVIRVESVAATNGGTTYPFAFYASGSTNAASYGYMGGTVCNLQAFASTTPACLGNPITLKLDSTKNGGSVLGLLSYNYTWTVKDGATNIYTFTDSGANPTRTFTPTTTGIFTGILQLTDNAGCSAIDTFEVIIGPNPIVTATSTPAGCDAPSGTITATDSDGTSPYAYSINGTTFQGNYFDNLNTGNYIVTVKDTIGCTANTDVTVANTSGFSASIASQTNQNCYGESLGSVTLRGDGGTNPYSYSMNGTTFQSDSVFSGLGAGNYTFTVKDISGCNFTVAANITQPERLAIAIDQVIPATCTASDGEITVSGNYGTSPYTYSIDNGTSFQSSGNFKNLAAKNYFLKIKDSKGCIHDSAVSVNSISNDLTIAVISKNNVSCYNGEDGSITVEAEKGTAPYTYAIGNTSYQTGSTFSNLKAGSYTITVKDNSGCVVTQVITIEQPAEFTVNITSTNIKCKGDCNGAAAAVVNGGTAPYTFNWSNGANTEVINNLCAGVYEVVVKDSKECTVNFSSTITEPASVIAAFTPAPEETTLSAATICFTDKSTGAVKWSWNFKDPKDIAGSKEPNPCHTYSDTGVYCVELMTEDANGCTGQVSNCVEITPDQEEFPLKFFIPNSFSPDNDGINDKFSGEGENFTDYEMYIFNRWGSLVFYTDDIKTKWEGKSGAEEGELLPDGVYVYLVNVKALNGKKHQFNGNVTLLRKE